VRNIVFESTAFEQFNNWALEDQKTYKRIIELVNDIQRHPFTGLGKPEPLKHNLKGYWSRRITGEHRMVYKVTEREILIIACRSHYR
jgi:toxin YoeB